MEIGKTYYVKWWNDDRESYWENIFKCVDVFKIYGTAMSRKYAYSVELLAVKDPTGSGVWTTKFRDSGSRLVLGSKIYDRLEVVPQKRSGVSLPDDWTVR
jgi:hypothetical protein